MFKKKEEPQQFILPEKLVPLSYNPNQSAANQIGSLAEFLLQAVETMKHKVVIETDKKVVEIIVSVETHKTTEDG